MTRRSRHRTLSFSALAACAFVFTGSFATASQYLPLTVEPGLTQRGEEPETWTVDLRNLDQAGADRIGAKLSRRLYGTSEERLVSPMTFATGFEEETIFAFDLSLVSVGGASLEVFIDGERFHRLAWPRAARTHITRRSRHRTLYWEGGFSFSALTRDRK